MTMSWLLRVTVGVGVAVALGGDLFQQATHAQGESSAGLVG